MMRKCLLALGTLFLAGLPAWSIAADAPPAAVISARATSSLLLDVARAGPRLVAVGERGHILLSDDEGASWRQVPAPTRALLAAVWFSGERNGWVVGHDSTILHSADGGETWVLQHHELFDADAVEDEFAAEEEDDADFGDGEETGRTASKAQRIGAPLMDVWFDGAGQRGFAVGAYGLLLATVDGGRTWSDRSDSLANAEGWHLSAIAAGKPGNLLLVGEKGIAFASADDGRSFSRVNTSSESSLFGVAGDADGYWAVGLQGRLYRVAGGWRTVATGVTYVLNDALVLADGTLVAVGNGGIVVSVPPGGKPSVVRRDDRQVISAAVAVKDGLVLVGEGGAKRARTDGSAR